MGPNVCRVVRHENRHVSHQPNAAGIAVSFQLTPLAMELELNERFEVDRRRQGHMRGFQDRACSCGVGSAPLGPGDAPLRFFQGCK